MKIWIFPRTFVKEILEKQEFRPNINIISINDTLEEAEVIKTLAQNIRILSLVFFDIDETVPEHPEYILFQEEHAKQILDFVKGHETENFVIHCAAGISRSGAVGTFLNDLHGEEYSVFKERNPNIIPNQHIVKTMRKTYDNLAERS